jgi:hypothetical protein
MVHHHVSVVLGLHLNPVFSGALVAPTPAQCAALGLPSAACTNIGTLLTTVLPVLNSPAAEEERSTICGPNTQNSGRGSNPAFGCQNVPYQSSIIAPAGGPPPPLYGQSSSFKTSSAQSSGPGFMAQQHQMSYSDLLLGH